MLNARLLDLDVLGRDDAVAMLDETVRIARPDDIRVLADHGGSAELAGVCAGLPLALRIAAALLAEDSDLSPRSLADQLRKAQPLQGLVYGQDGVSRAFALSYRALTEEQQRMFWLLALNPGPDISTEAAAVLAGDITDSAALALCRELVRAHLLEHGSGRWRMHDLVRQYATALAGRHPDQAAQATGRLMSYYLATARNAVAHLNPTEPDPAGRGFTTRSQAMQWLDTERANLTAAPHTAAAIHPDIAINLSLALARYLHRRRLFSDWTTLTTLARDTARLTGDRHGEGQALNHLGLALGEVGRFAEAIIALQQVSAIFSELGDRHGEGHALADLGVALRGAGRFEEAIAAGQAAVRIFEETNDRAGEAGARQALHDTLQLSNRPDER